MSVHSVPVLLMEIILVPKNSSLSAVQNLYSSTHTKAIVYLPHILIFHFFLSPLSSFCLRPYTFLFVLTLLSLSLLSLPPPLPAFVMGGGSRTTPSLPLNPLEGRAVRGGVSGGACELHPVRSPGPFVTLCPARRVVMTVSAPP